MTKLINTTLLLLILISCSSPAQKKNSDTLKKTKDSGASLFWDNLSALCGKTFEGNLVTDPVEGFSGERLVMHVLSCNEEQILIPFNVGDNRSRTWIFTRKDTRIELKHDHRMEDGSDDEITMYGGTSSNNGSASLQFFPADQETQDNIPYAFSNVWWVTVSDCVYSYNLKRIGRTGEFTVEFDLTNEIETPEPSWGWEDFDD